MTEELIQAHLAFYAAKYPRPELTSDEAAAVARRTVGTIHNWSSQGKLDACASNPGRLRIDRDAFVRLLVTGALDRGIGGGRGRARRPRTRPTELEELP